MSSTDGTEVVLRAISDSAHRHGVADTRLLVGYSGGPDSGVLLHGLVQCRHELSLRIVAAHFDHGLRPEEERRRERELVIDTARRLNVDLLQGNAEPEEIRRESEARRESLEGVARRHRYRFWARCLEERGFGALVLAHHLNDQAETVVMRLVQGSGLQGLKGMEEWRWNVATGELPCPVWRPLLTVTRSDIEAYAARATLPYIVDSTNLGRAPLRNRIRHSVMPALAEAEPDFLRKISASSVKLSEADDALEADVERRKPWSVTERRAGAPVRVEAAVADFAACGPELRRRVLYRAVSLLGKDPAKIPARFFRPLVYGEELARAGQVLRGHGLRAGCAESVLYLASDVVPGAKKGYCITVLSADARPGPVHLQVTRGGGGERLGEAEFARAVPPVIVRTARAGDRVVERGGAALVSDRVAELGLPEGERDSVPIVEDRIGVRAILRPPRGNGTTTQSGESDRVEGRPHHIGVDLDSEVVEHE